MNWKAPLVVLHLSACLVAAPATWAGTDNEKIQSTGKQSRSEQKGKSPDADKSCLKSTMQCCTDRAKRSVDAINEIMSDLSQAGKSGDQAQMKQAIDEATKELATLKEQHDKSYHLLNAATKHLEKIKKSGNAKVKKLIDESDPSFDDLIWAY